MFTYDSTGEIEPGQVFIQLKASDNVNVLGDGLTITLPVKRSDLALWLDEPMPYMLVLYDARADVAYWLYVQAYFARLGDFSLPAAGDIVVVHLQKSNVVNDEAIRRFGQYKNAILRQVRRMGGIEHHE
jgi:hypothetical protein